MCCWYSSLLCICWMKEMKSNILLLLLLLLCVGGVGVVVSRGFQLFYLRFDLKCFTEEDQKSKYFCVFLFPLLCRQTTMIPHCTCTEWQMTRGLLREEGEQEKDVTPQRVTPACDGRQPKRLSPSIKGREQVSDQIHRLKMLTCSLSWCHHFIPNLCTFSTSKVEFTFDLPTFFFICGVIMSTIQHLQLSDYIHSSCVWML